MKVANIINIIVLFLINGIIQSTQAVSFSVDKSSMGLVGTALRNEPPPAPNDIFNAVALSSNNTLDVTNINLGLPQDAPPELNALSAGFEPLDEDLWDIIFSVKKDSVGKGSSSVNFRATGGNAVGGDLFFTNPALQGTNRWLIENTRLGLLNTQPDDLDAAEVFHSPAGFEVLYNGFTSFGHNVYFSLQGSADILIWTPGVGIGNYRTSAQLGLGNNDDIDALALDVNFNNDGVVEALFSLAPGSPSLIAGGFSAADVFYTKFDGTFQLAGPANINFSFELTASNLGLLDDDNLDAFDIVYTSTVFRIPQDPDFPPDIPVVKAENIKTIYCLHDDGLNDSQFCYGMPLPAPPIVRLGPLYKDCDIEALDILHTTDDLYAAAGDDTPRKGHLYYVYKHNGDIVDLGDPNGPGQLDEIDALSFHPITNQLWGWAQGEGLFVINTLTPPLPAPFPQPFLSSPIPSIPIFPQGIQIQPIVNIDNPICLPPISKVPLIPATIVLNKPVEVEDITWNWRGDIIYAVENAHTDNVDSHGKHEDFWPYANPKDYDFDQADVDGDGEKEGVTLWASDGSIIKEVCHDLSPKIIEKLGAKAEIEALESLPPNLIPTTEINPDTEDLLLVGFHGPRTMLYAVIITPSITSVIPT
jgi:hypothetical protein